MKLEKPFLFRAIFVEALKDKPVKSETPSLPSQNTNRITAEDCRNFWQRAAETKERKFCGWHHGAV